MRFVEVGMEVYMPGSSVWNVEGVVKLSSMGLLLFPGCSEQRSFG